MRVAGDRLARARRVRGRPRPGLRRREPRAPDPAAAPAHGARARSAARAVRPADRGQPARPAQAAYETFDELVGYCDLSANPVGELVLHVFGAATPDRIALSDRVCTALQLAEHWQDVAEDHAAGRIYLPAEDLDRFGVAPDDLGGRRDRPTAARADGVRGRPRPRAARRGRAARRPASRPRADRRRGLRRRRPRRARRDRRRAATTCSPGAPKAGRGGRARSTLATYAPEAMTVSGPRRAGLRALPPRRPRVGLELLRRHAAAAAGPARRALRDLRPRAPDRRHRRRRAPRRREARGARRSAHACARAPRRERRRRARRRRRRRRRFPIPLEAFGELVDGAELDVRGDRVRDVRRARALLPLRRGLDRAALARRLRLLGPDRRRRRSPTTSASRCRSGTSCATSARTPPIGRVYLPREDLERFGCEADGGDVRRARSSSLIAFEAERGLGWLHRGLDLVPLLDRRSASCVLAMAGKYRRLLERIAAEPTLVLRGRLSLRPWEKGLVLARSLAGPRT